MTSSGKNPSWKDMDAQERQAAGRAYEMLSNYDALTRGWREEDREARLTFADLYHYVTEPFADLSLGQRQALAKDAKLGQALDRLLAKNSVYHFPRVAAASSGVVTEREGDGFKVKLKESRADAGQVYIILILEDHVTETPKGLAAKTAEGDYVKLMLSDIEGGVAQMLEAEESDIVRALRDVKTELYLL